MSDAQPEVNPEVRPDTAADEVVVPTELKNIIEALVFASDEPMTVRFIRSIMEDVNKDLPPSEQFVVNADIIRKAVTDLNRGYTKLGSGFRIIEIAGGFTYATLEQFSSWVGKLAKEKARRRLSPTAVETLAIIAYKQPIAKGEVEFIRGVNVDYIINALLEKDLIHITGRANTPGRPLLYGTTQKFLEHFGLNDLTDLPKPREIAELISETEIEVDRRLLAEQQELEFKEDLEKKLEGNEGSKNKPVKQQKAKVPENIREENRRAAKEAAAGPSSAENVPTAEGATPSESNSTIPEAVQANVPAQPEDTVPVQPEGIVLNQPEGNVPVQEMPQEDSAEHAAEAEPAADVHIVPEPEMPAETDAAPAGPMTAEPPVPEVNEGILSLPEPPQPEVTNRIDVPAEAVPVTDERSIAAEQPPIAEGHTPPAGTEQNAPGQEKGWSKWKNKVKTFFQKLFA